MVVEFNEEGICYAMIEDGITSYHVENIVDENNNFALTLHKSELNKNTSYTKHKKAKVRVIIEIED